MVCYGIFWSGQLYTLKGLKLNEIFLLKKVWQRKVRLISTHLGVVFFDLLFGICLSGVSKIQLVVYYQCCVLIG